MQMTEEKLIRCDRCNKFFDSKNKQIVTVKIISESSHEMENVLYDNTEQLTVCPECYNRRITKEYKGEWNEDLI